MIVVTQSQLSKVEVDYVTMPGWNSKIAGITAYSDLHINAKNYIVKIQELTGIPSEWADVTVATQWLSECNQFTSSYFDMMAYFKLGISQT